MAIIKSAKKALRQSFTHRKRNDQRKDKTKKLLKEVKFLLSQKKFDEAKKILPEVFKSLDKAAKIGVTKKNTVSRKKSRIAKMFPKIK